MTTPQPETDLVADFLPRLASVVQTLRTNAQDDPELLAHVGSLASELVKKGGNKNWGALKSALSNEAYDGLLNDCQKQASALAKRGNQKSAYAVEVIATSIIAGRFTDEKIAEGNKLLDNIINRSARAYNTAKIKPAAN